MPVDHFDAPVLLVQLSQCVPAHIGGNERLQFRREAHIVALNSGFVGGSKGEAGRDLVREALGASAIIRRAAEVDFNEGAVSQTEAVGAVVRAETEGETRNSPQPI